MSHREHSEAIGDFLSARRNADPGTIIPLSNAELPEQTGNKLKEVPIAWLPSLCSEVAIPDT